jgi:hypothetical protein
MKLKIVLVISVCFTFYSGSKAIAQKVITSDTSFSHSPADIYRGMPLRPFHLGLVYPLSTNGHEAPHYVNRVSMHLFAGVDGGLTGVAFSGLVNVSFEFTEGVQFAGIANYSGGNTQGVQFAGIVNVSVRSVEGLQAAGIVNVVADSVSAGQFAGIANVVAGPQNGLQMAGITNVNASDSDGSQFAGIANINASRFRGGQFAGIANVAARSVRGAQVAGITNVADSVTGAQVAGLINVANKVNGAQIGFINIADSVEGISIGFLSIISHGYHRVEFSGSEALHAQFAIKLGVQKFYNIFAFGYHFSDADPWEYGNEPTWAYGYGIGTEFNLSQTWKMNMDLTTFDVIEKENTFKHKELNLLNQFRLNFGAQLGSRFAIVFGPSFNVMVSRLQGSDNGDIGSDLAPWTVYDKTHDGTNVKMWPGFNVSLRF